LVSNRCDVTQSHTWSTWGAHLYSAVGAFTHPPYLPAECRPVAADGQPILADDLGGCRVLGCHDHRHRREWPRQMRPVLAGRAWCRRDVGHTCRTHHATTCRTHHDTTCRTHHVTTRRTHLVTTRRTHHATSHRFTRTVVQTSCHTHHVTPRHVSCEHHTTPITSRHVTCHANIRQHPTRRVTPFANDTPPPLSPTVHNPGNTTALATTCDTYAAGDRLR
jgi:hypothetical protein